MSERRKTTTTTTTTAWDEWVKHPASERASVRFLALRWMPPLSCPYPTPTQTPTSQFNMQLYQDTWHPQIGSPVTCSASIFGIVSNRPRNSSHSPLYLNGCVREREREGLKKRVWMRIIFIFGFKFYLWDIELNCIYIRILNLLIAYLLLISSISHPINNSFPNLLILQFQLQLDPPWYSLIRLG